MIKLFPLPVSKKPTKPPTLTALAKHLDLSVATVSYVLNNRIEENRIPKKTAERVRKAARELGYVPNQLARSLRRQRTGAVGLIFSDLEASWAHRALQGVLASLDPAGYIPYISVHFWDSERERNEIHSLVGRRVEGIITVPQRANIELYRQIIAQGTPIVFLQDGLEETPDISYAMWDAAPAAAAAVRHLVETGRKRLLFYGVDEPTKLMNVRAEGFREGCREARLPVDDSWIFHEPLVRIPAHHEEIAEFGQSLRIHLDEASHRPEGIVAMNDSLAYTALDVVKRRLGMAVPGEIAIVGLGDLPQSDPLGLSSMYEPVGSVGKATADVLVKLIDDPRAGPIESLVPRIDLHARGTSGPCPLAAK